ncbi:hypothetical protein Taro_048636, partial [Colocasia esculenta]|nr:hypothetical protein [Colocasia esculenta]
CVDTQADCVDTTGYWLQNRLLGGRVSVDTQADCVDTTAYWFQNRLLGGTKQPESSVLCSISKDRQPNDSSQEIKLE